MDPTMGLAPIADEQQPLTTATPSNVIGMSGYLNQADMQADQTGGTEASGLGQTTEVFAADVSTEVVLAAVLGEEQPAAEAFPAPVTPPEPPKYPIGAIDFNKPFEIFRTDDNRDFLSEVSILSVLKDASHPVVIAGYHDNEAERVVLQFDLEGDDIRGDWQLKNLSTEPQTKYVRVFIDDDRNLTTDEEVYDTEAAANRAYSHNEVLGVFSITIPPRVPAVAEAVAEELTDDEYSEEEEHDEGDADFHVEVAVVEPTPAAPPHPDAKWVNGRLIAPGQMIRAYRPRLGVRDVEVVKTRDHAYQALFIKPQDGSNPYWALNKNIR